MERRALCLVSAVLLGLSAAGAAGAAAADGIAAPEEAVQGHGKLGTAHLTPDLSEEPLERRLAERGMAVGSPIMIRIFKAEAELELWMEVGGRFELFEVYPICNWSGSLGPKRAEGDKQSPEGLYSIGRRQLHHSARWRQSLDIGYPNAFDRSHARTGSYILLHGGCTSTGCYAMTDPVIDEIFRLSAAALSRGQRRIQVHAFPFRMTPENMAVHADDEWNGFWANLKEAYDVFERTRLPPSVSVCNHRYVVSEAGTNNDECRGGTSVSQAGQSADARAARRRKAMRAYAAARRARQAARAKAAGRQRHAAQGTDQRRLPR